MGHKGTVSDVAHIEVIPEDADFVPVLAKSIEEVLADNDGVVAFLPDEDADGAARHLDVQVDGLRHVARERRRVKLVLVDFVTPIRQVADRDAEEVSLKCQDNGTKVTMREAMARCGIEVTQEEAFYVEPKKEDAV